MSRLLPFTTSEIKLLQSLHCCTNILQFKPNPTTTAYKFYYRLAVQYKLYNNAFAFPVWNESTGKLEAIYNINASEIKLLEYQGELFCKFKFINGKEVITRGALDGCDMSDFIFNRNHGENDGTVYARTRNNSLTYSITDSGLDITATLDKEDDRHRNLHRDIQKRRVDKMSFSFIVRESSYDRETHTRTITKIKKLYDVSAVDFPAYNETSITTARDFFSAEREKELKEQEQQRRRKMLIAQTYC